MGEDAYALAAFMCVAVVFDSLEHFVEHMPQYRKAVRWIRRGALVTPVVLHAFKDFAIHVLVYSGHGFAY